MLKSRRSKLAPSARSKLVIRKRTDEFYLSRAWKDFVAALIKERGRRCEGCGKTREDDGSFVRLIADHKIERQDGGADFDKANIQLLCCRAGGDGRPHADGDRGGCHPRKTARAKADRLSLLGGGGGVKKPPLISEKALFHS
ncbi:MAG: HNH endonuclease, partial [Alphaproteobacteria bacterium]|nr:HNH endonuclease [Alphaproteobacteria bacterium]